MYKCLKYLAHLATKQFGSLLTITYEGLLNWQIGKAFRKNSIVSVFTLSHIPTTPTNKMKSDRFRQTEFSKTTRHMKSLHPIFVFVMIFPQVVWIHELGS